MRSSTLNHILYFSRPDPQALNTEVKFRRSNFKINCRLTKQQINTYVLPLQLSLKHSHFLISVNYSDLEILSLSTNVFLESSHFIGSLKYFSTNKQPSETTLSIRQNIAFNIKRRKFLYLTNCFVLIREYFSLSIINYQGLVKGAKLC